MAAKLLVVGHDAAPSRALRKLADHAFDKGYSTDIVLLDAGTIQPPSDHSLEVKVQNADVVVIGMSTPSENATVEMTAALFCIRHNKPFGFYADTHGAWTRPHFERFRELASFVFTVNDDESNRAAQLFPNACICATGNPLWAPFFEHADRDESRARIRAQPDEYIVLAPGTKNAVHNKTVWEATIKAAGLYKNHVVICARHPGDKTPGDEYAYLSDLAREHGVRVVFLRDATDLYVPGADLVINGTSVRIHALARLIPVIDYYEESSQDWLEKDIGSRTGYFYGTGAVVDVYGETWEDLGAAMALLRHNPTLLRARQAAAVQKSTAQQSLDAMLEGIGHVLS